MFIVCPKCAAKYQIPPEITMKEGQKVQCSACQYIFAFQNKKESVQNESVVSQIPVPDDPVLPIEESVVQKEHEEKVVYTHELPEVFQPLEPISNNKPYKWLWVVVCLLFFFLLVAGIWLYRDVLKMDYTSSSYPKFSLPRMDRKVMSSSPKEKVEETIDIPLFEEDNLPPTIDSEIKNVQLDAFRFHSIRFRTKGSDLLIEGMIHNDTNIPQSMPASVYATAYDQRGNVLFKKEIFLPNEILPPYGQKAFFGSYSPVPDGVQWVEVSCKN